MDTVLGRCLRPALLGKARATFRVSAAVAASIAIAGCGEPETICVKSHMELMLIPQYNPALKTTTVQHFWRPVCDERAPNPKFTGEAQ